MDSFAGQERSALHGIAYPGHHGRLGFTGLVIEERTDVSLASVIAKRGRRDALVSAVDTRSASRCRTGRAGPAKVR